MRVVVIGGGYGGMASAARLAKLGHQVTLVERSARLGGALSSVEHSGFRWDAGPSVTLLPAVARDLFRKSGRPLERELELVPVEVIREHRFADGTSLRLAGGSRGAQKSAFEALGPGLGTQWTQYVDSLAADWELVRRDYLERPWDPALARRGSADLLRSRRSLHRRWRGALRDERLRLVAGHPLRLDGHDPRQVPAWLGTISYVEQRFGAWTAPGGLAQLGEVLAARLSTRRVEVIRHVSALDIVQRQGRVAALDTTAGEIDADAVVCAIDPRALPTLAPYVARTRTTLPPTVTHLGLRGPVPLVPAELVLHGRPTVVVRRGAAAPDGHVGVTVLHRGGPAIDALEELAAHGLDVREQVVARLDRSPEDQVRQWGGSPLGLRWEGRGTVRRRLGPGTPVPGVYTAGAHAAPGSGLPFVGLSAALVAQALGPA